MMLNRFGPNTKTVFLEITILIAATTMLSGAALFNGFPLVFSDSGTYLRTLIEFTVPWDRPVYYGIFAGLLARLGGLWLIVVAQAVIVYGVLRLTLFCSGGEYRPYQIAVMITVLCITTALPWYVGQIMPDIFAPLAVLCVYLMVFRKELLPKYTYVVVFLLACLVQAIHYSHLMLTLGLCFVLLILSLLFRRKKLVRLANLLPVAATSGLAIAALLLVHYVERGQVIVSPAGHVFLMGRLVEDGLVEEYLRQECPNHPYRLCAFVDRLPTSVNDYIWLPDSPLQFIGGPEGSRAESMAIIVGSIRTLPRLYLWSVLKNFINQFLSFETGSGLITYLDDTRINLVIKKSYSDKYDHYINSRQTREDIDFHSLNKIHRPIGFLSIVLNLAMLVAALYRRRLDLAMMIGVILIGIAGNALIIGALSACDPRYQARILWLLVFSAMVGLKEGLLYYQMRRRGRR